MAGRGRKVTFHGAFKNKSKAVAKERKVKGSYIEETMVNGMKRFVVIKRKD